ncbi:MAG: 50S ribosomal protein L23 [Chloroflexota bacterium]|nr:50S ribosomal protein L23 [Chloroflexota bacterium]
MAGLHLYDVILRPVVTEKTNLLTNDFSQYVFEVAPDANKQQIRNAVATIFEVKVKKVNTLIMPAKRGMRGRRVYMRSKQWKKAIVTLEAGERIELFEV